MTQLAGNEAVGVIQSELEAIEFRWRLCDEIESLPDQMREVIKLHYVQQYPIGEVSKHLQLSDEACQQIAWDSLRYLKNALGDSLNAVTSP